MVIMTVPLEHLSSHEAVALLQPYVTTPGYQNAPGGGVFPVPNGHAVTTSLASLLRSGLKYTGFELVGVGVARTGENAQASETITGEGQKFTLSLNVADVLTWGPMPAYRSA